MALAIPQKKVIKTMATSFAIKVRPKSGSQKCSLSKNGTIVISLKSAAENNKANTELVAFIATLLKIPREHVVIVKGMTTPQKIIRLREDISHVDLLKKLGIDAQHALF
ncbi:MAG: hypothetical protein UU47_C0013G0003 [candidate division TM6 bacterium GW2011_GWE2_41_16]|nr:MAG: hypothetical protein UU47_C0013G0003 [candidate division TM6 bacterium GW2011_GWE2_41_16]